MFNKDARHYDSCLQAALDRNNVPTAVYTQLISDVHANLPTLHRYLKLRQRMMGVDQLRYEDLYASIVKEVDLHFTPEQAMDLTLKACAPLGKTYVDDLKKGYDSRWVDFMPSTGKRSGAYSNGAAYDVHPYQLLNFMGGYDDVSTLAHESGHSMHTFLSNKHQPYITADYPIFVAEVASHPQREPAPALHARARRPRTTPPGSSCSAATWTACARRSSARPCSPSSSSRSTSGPRRATASPATT